MAASMANIFRKAVLMFPGLMILVMVAWFQCNAGLILANDAGQAGEYLQPGPYAVGYQEIKDRPEMNMVRVDGKSERLPISIWHPKDSAAGQSPGSADSARFPVILLCPGFNAKADSYATIVEYLVSHGFVIGSFPSYGSNFTGGQMGKYHEFREALVKYLHATLKQIENIAAADPDHLGVMGHSFGGPAALLYALRHNRVQAAASLDGSDACRGATARIAAASPEFDPGKFAASYLLLLADRDYCVGEMRDLTFYNRLSRAPAYVLNFPALGHDDFGFTSSRPTEPRPRRSCEIATRYMLHFFNAYLRNDPESLARLKKSVKDSGYPADLFAKSAKNLGAD